MLKKIQEGKATLPETDLKTKTFVSSTLETDAFASTFKRDTVQW